MPAMPPASVSHGMHLECRNICFGYEYGGTRVPALRDVSFSVPAGSSLALLGASGSGKSTLLEVLRGLDVPDAGQVVLDGVRPGERAYGEAQRDVGIVFQMAEVQLFAATAREDVAFGPRQLGWSDVEVNSATEDAFASVGLSEKEYGWRHPYSLSGGEARRLALAGVLAMRPRAILLDEPFVSLDPSGRRDLVEILERLRVSGVTLVLVTHDLDLAWQLCDMRVLLDEGAVIAAGSWDFCGDDARILAANRLREPLLVELWRRLGLPPQDAPRSVAEAAQALL